MFLVPSVVIAYLLSQKELLLILLVLTLFAFLYNRAYLNPLSNIPGPFINKFTNIPLRYHVVIGNYHNYTIALHAKYGELVRTGFNQISVTNGPEMRRILATHNYRKGAVYESTSALSPTTFTTTDPESNKTKRRQLGNTYSIARIRSLEDVILENGAMSLIRHWDNKIRETKEGNASRINYFYAFHGLAFDIIGMLGYGKRFDVLANDNVAMVDNVHKMLVLAAIQGNIPIVKRMQWLVRDMANARSQFIAIAENAISDRTHELKHLPMSNTSPHTDILQKLIDSKDPVTGMALCGKPLVSEMVGVLIAGTDTTSNTLTWTTMHLMNHPEIYKRLCQDIRREFPDLSKPIRYEEAKTHLPYLTAVILEAMRLTPSVAGFLPRRTPPEGTTIKGHFIPAMNEIGISIAAFHRNPNLWPNPSTFDPERFMGTNMESNIKEILPFSTGVRVCVGRNLAWVELYTVLANSLRMYDFKLPDDSPYGPDKLVNGIPQEIPGVSFTTCGPVDPMKNCWILVSHANQGA